MTRMLRIIAIIILIFCALLAYVFGQSARAEQTFLSVVAHDTSFIDEIDAYHVLLRAVGATRAQEVLVAHFPNDSKTHTLDHETGKFLYETKGARGISECNSSFAGGCYHGFIEAAIGARGVGALQDVVASCTDALSSEQTMQCAHGVGHALLAEVAGYAHLPDALSLCDRAFAGDYKRTVNCYDGVFMENNFGAFSVPPTDRWYKASDPMYPCNTPAVLAKNGAHEYCWGMQSQLTLHADAYPQFKGDVTRVAVYCHTLGASDEHICLEGLSRQIQLTYGRDAAEVRTKCDALGADKAFCIAHAAEASYIYGDHSNAVLNTCNAMPASDRAMCYETFFEGIAVSYSATSTRLNACAHDIADDAYKAQCVTWINSPEGMNF